MPSAIEFIQFGRPLWSKCRNVPHDHQEQVSECSVYAYYKVIPGMFLKGLDGTIVLIIDEAWSPVLDTARISHFVFASS